MTEQPVVIGFDGSHEALRAIEVVGGRGAAGVNVWQPVLASQVIMPTGVGPHVPPVDGDGLRRIAKRVAEIPANLCRDAGLPAHRDTRASSGTSGSPTPCSLRAGAPRQARDRRPA